MDVDMSLDDVSHQHLMTRFDPYIPSPLTPVLFSPRTRQMIAAKPRAGGRRGGRTSGARPAATRVVSNGHLGGARERYAQGAVPSAQAVQSRQAAAATKVQNGPRNDDPAFRAVKIIISNLPLDVDDAAVRVRLLISTSHFTLAGASVSVSSFRALPRPGPTDSLPAPHSICRVGLGH